MMGLKVSRRLMSLNIMAISGLMAYASTTQALDVRIDFGVTSPAVVNWNTVDVNQFNSQLALSLVDFDTGNDSGITFRALSFSEGGISSSGDWNNGQDKAWVDHNAAQDFLSPDTDEIFFALEGLSAGVDYRVEWLSAWDGFEVRVGYSVIEDNGFVRPSANANGTDIGTVSSPAFQLFQDGFSSQNWVIWESVQAGQRTGFADGIFLGAGAGSNFGGPLINALRISEVSAVVEPPVTVPLPSSAFLLATCSILAFRRRQRFPAA